MKLKPPEWQQDSSNKNLQPFQIPQFEVAGNQTDHENYQRAMKLVVGRATVAIVLLACCSIFFFLDDIAETHSNFAQFDTSTPESHRNALRLNVHSIERKKSIEGLLFDSSPQPGFSFIVVEVSVSNLHKTQPYTLSIYAIKIVTSDGITYSTDLHTRSFKGRLPNGVIKPGAAKRGFLVFRIPSNKALERIEVRGGQGELATVNI